MGKVNSITKLEIAIFVFLTMMISGASSIASNDFIRIIVVGLLALYSFINHKILFIKWMDFNKPNILIIFW